LVAADGAKSQVRKQRCANANGGKGFLMKGKIQKQNTNNKTIHLFIFFFK